MGSMALSDELQKALRNFADARDWDQFHSPKNLVLALAGEVGELAAEFQWLTEAESRSLDDERLSRVAHEIGDVFIYLLRLADKLSIDLEQAAWDKLDLNAERYPVALAKGRSSKYTDLREGDG